jgi:hypothetical protein
VFSSAAADTARLTVTCDGHEAGGTTEAAYAGATATKCSVKAILADRSRLYGEVDGATAGHYTCFADGAKACTRQGTP